MLLAIFLAILALLYLLAKLSTKLLFDGWSTKWMRRFYVLAVSLHELMHFLGALLVFKWPKFQPIRIEEENGHMRISGGVEVRHYQYKSLLYNALHGDFLISGFLLLYEFVARLIIGIAPVGTLLALIFFGLHEAHIALSIADISAIDAGKIGLSLLFLPFVTLLSVMAQPSWQDLKNAAVPLLLLGFVNTPEVIATALPLALFLAVMLGEMVVFWLLVSVFLRK